MSRHDLDRLIKFVSREPWTGCFDEIFDTHFGALFESLDMAFEDLSEIVGEYQASTSWAAFWKTFLRKSSTLKAATSWMTI